MTVSIRTKNLRSQKCVNPQAQIIFEAPKTKVEELFAVHFSNKNCSVKHVGPGNLEVANCSEKDLHRFILDLEKEGKEVSIEKKTILEISNRK